MTVICTDIFDPAHWTDFFVMVGTGAAALTGLVFVAMSINVGAISANPTHRYRAIGNLVGLASVFMLSALVLMGQQNHQAVGAEILIVSAGASGVLLFGYAKSRRFGGSSDALSTARTVGGSICYIVEILGAVVLIAGQVAGLYITSVAIVANFYFMISGAWLLLIGKSPDDAGRVGSG
jgi:hypothetical protein